jgi:signal transduction histidine kinase
MKLPSLFRRTPFRLTLLFLALFAASASALLAYIYVATASEDRKRADSEVRAEVTSLEAIYRAQGPDALNQALVDRTVRGGPFLFLLSDKDGKPITGNISESPIASFRGRTHWEDFRISQTDDEGKVERRAARGVERPLAGGQRLFVGVDIGDSEAHLGRITQAMWGAGALVVLLGLGGGVVISRGVERSMGSLNLVVAAVRDGDLLARAPVRGSRDEFDELATNLNGMLDRLEASVAAIRHAGDAVAHDLRSPLTRMRTKLEVALIDAEAGRADAVAALETALSEADGLLKTFNIVLAIARLEAAGQAPNPSVFDAAELAGDLAELYEYSAEEHGIDFGAEIQKQLPMLGSREFVAQALANLIDNALKYTPQEGAVMLRARRKASGEVEFSVTDTGPGVPEEDRQRVVQRFVRLENSRSEPGSGLGLSLVAAVAKAHGGRLELDEGPGMVDGKGPGLRVALVFPPA